MDKKTILLLLVLAALVAGALVFYSPSPVVTRAGTGTLLHGYAWSSNIGWVSFNSADCDIDQNGYVDETGACSGDNATEPVRDYSVGFDAASGGFNGYAWSPNIGWIQFDTGGPYPANPASAARLAGGNVTGWIRALTPAGNLAAAGGWDGWIKMSKDSGDGGSDYGVRKVTLSDTGSFALAGFAWGGDVVGWLSFRNEIEIAGTTDPDCVANPNLPQCDNTECDPTPANNFCGGVCVGDCGSGGDGLRLTCSFTPVSPTIDDTVTWTANASGGSSSSNYTYCWGTDCDPDLSGEVTGADREVTTGPYRSTGSHIGQAKVTDNQGTTDPGDDTTAICTAVTATIGAACFQDSDCSPWTPDPCTAGQDQVRNCPSQPAGSGCSALLTSRTCIATPPQLEVLPGRGNINISSNSSNPVLSDYAEVKNIGDRGTFCIDTMTSSDGQEMRDTVSGAISSLPDPNPNDLLPQCALQAQNDTSPFNFDRDSCNPDSSAPACILLNTNEVAKFQLRLPLSIRSIRSSNPNDTRDRLPYAIKIKPDDALSDPDGRSATIYLRSISGSVYPL